jgi:four helix bundle protein
MNKDNIILTKSFDFALQIIELYKQMKAQNEYVLSKQVLRSGTSIGAMLRRLWQELVSVILFIKCQ